MPRSKYSDASLGSCFSPVWSVATACSVSFIARYSLASPWYAGMYFGSSRSACWYALRAWSRLSLASTGDRLASASPAYRLPQTVQTFGVGSFLGRSLSFLILSGSMWAACVGVGAGVAAGAAAVGVVLVPVVEQPAMPPSRASDQSIRLRQS